MRYYLLYGVLLIACAGISLWNMRSFEGDAGWVIHTLAVQSAAAQLQSLLVDAETGERGYLLVGSEDYLAPYDEAVDKINDQKQLLRIMTSDNPKQQHHLEELDHLVDERLTRLQLTIQARRASGLDAARALIATGIGKRQMDSIRHTIGDMLNEESVLLITRQGNMNRSAVIGKGFFVGLFALSCLALGCLYWQVRCVIVEREARAKAAEAILAQTDVLGATLKVNGSRSLVDITQEAQAVVEQIRALAGGLQPGKPSRQS